MPMPCCALKRIIDADALLRIEAYYFRHGTQERGERAQRAVVTSRRRPSAAPRDPVLPVRATTMPTRQLFEGLIP